MITSKEHQGEAFSQEARVNRYLVCATQAEKDGYPQIARLFRATAREGKSQSADFLWAPGGMDTVKRILNEVKTLPPWMIAPVQEEADHELQYGLRCAIEDEKPGASSYQKALEQLAELAKGDYYVCSDCGYINKRMCPEKCPRCQSKAICMVKVG